MFIHIAGLCLLLAYHILQCSRYVDSQAAVISHRADFFLHPSCKAAKFFFGLVESCRKYFKV